MKAGRAGGLLGSPIGVVFALSTSMSLLVAACGGSSGATSAADQSFVAAVHLAAPDIGSFRSDTQLIRLGHASCDAFRSGASYEQIADRMSLLEGQNPVPSQDLGAVVTGAVDAYCPQFRSQV